MNRRAATYLIAWPVVMWLALALPGCPLIGVDGTWSIKAVSTGPSGTEREERWEFTFYIDGAVKWTKEGQSASGRYVFDKELIVIDSTFGFGGGAGAGSAKCRLACELALDEETDTLSGPFTLTLITPHPGSDKYTGTLEGLHLEKAATW